MSKPDVPYMHFDSDEQRQIAHIAKQQKLTSEEVIEKLVRVGLFFYREFQIIGIHEQPKV